MPTQAKFSICLMSECHPAVFAILEKKKSLNPSVFFIEFKNVYSDNNMNVFIEL